MWEYTIPTRSFKKVFKKLLSVVYVEYFFLTFLITIKIGL